MRFQLEKQVSPKQSLGQQTCSCPRHAQMSKSIKYADGFQFPPLPSDFKDGASRTPPPLPPWPPRALPQVVEDVPRPGLRGILRDSSCTRQPSKRSVIFNQKTRKFSIPQEKCFGDDSGKPLPQTYLYEPGDPLYCVQEDELQPPHQCTPLAETQKTRWQRMDECVPGKEPRKEVGESLRTGGERSMDMGQPKRYQREDPSKRKCMPSRESRTGDESGKEERTKNYCPNHHQMKVKMPMDMGEAKRYQREDPYKRKCVPSRESRTGGESGKEERTKNYCPNHHQMKMKMLMDMGEAKWYQREDPSKRKCVPSRESRTGGESGKEERTKNYCPNHHQMKVKMLMDMGEAKRYQRDDLFKRCLRRS